MSKQEVDININITVSPDGIGPNKVTKDLEEPIEKIMLSISVAQLAYIFKVLVDMGTIKNKNVSDVMRFIIKNISTPKAQDISFDSLKTKYYQPEHSTKQFFHDFLIQQLNYVRKELKM